MRRKEFRVQLFRFRLRLSRWCGLQISVLLVPLADHLAKILVRIRVVGRGLFTLIQPLLSAFLDRIAYGGRPQSTKSSKLIGRQDLSNREFVREANAGDIGLRLLEIVEPSPYFVLIDIVGVYRSIERLICSANPALSVVYLRLSLLVELTDLLELIRR